MPTQPDTTTLLSAARDTLLKDILPQLPPAAHAHGEHVALALAIVFREIEAAAKARTIDTGLSAIHPENRTPRETTLRHLAAEIRNGRFDNPGAEQTAMLNDLRRTTAKRLAIDNPEYS